MQAWRREDNDFMQENKLLGRGGRINRLHGGNTHDSIRRE
jgi:hypothetical protein